MQKQKRFLKSICINSFYIYDIYEIDAGQEKWFEAVPQNKGVTRVASDETKLKKTLMLDAVVLNKFWIKVK